MEGLPVQYILAAWKWCVLTSEGHSEFMMCGVTWWGSSASHTNLAVGVFSCWAQAVQPRGHSCEQVWVPPMTTDAGPASKVLPNSSRETGTSPPVSQRLRSLTESVSHRTKLNCHFSPKIKASRNRKYTKFIYILKMWSQLMKYAFDRQSLDKVEGRALISNLLNLILSFFKFF